MTSWSNSPFPGVVDIGTLGPAGRTLGENTGESRRVVELSNHPGWLLKEYYTPATPTDIRRLDELIELPRRMGSVDLAMVNRATGWPVARVTRGGGTVGVVLPLAPARFSAEFRLPSGKPQVRTLLIDLLAMPDAYLTERGITGQAPRDRMAVCANVAAVGALFERHHLVYLDWSYANIFWSRVDHCVFVIDIDGCSFGPRLQTENINWSDPLVPRKHMAGIEVDRYRVALLTARCLTGRRETPAATAALEALAAQDGTTTEAITRLVVQAVSATSLDGRPKLAELHGALARAVQGSGGTWQPTVEPPPDGVKEWREIRPPAAASAPPDQPPGQPSRPAQPAHPGGSPETGSPETGSPETGAGIVLVVTVVVVLIVILVLVFKH